MTIFEHARKLEAKLARTFTEAAQRVAQPVMPADGLPPLHIVHGIIDAVEDEVQPAGRGLHVFPFNRIYVSVVAADRDARARVEAIIDATPSLTDRIIERLRAAGCDPSGVTVKVAYVSQPDACWRNPAFHLDLARQTRGPVDTPVERTRPTLQLRILAGSAEMNEYSLSLGRIDLGRCAEVRDDRHRLIRTNHVAFRDGAGAVNESVSRRHAHIVYSEPAGEYRVYDDRSSHGTCLLRNSTTIVVPPGARGIRLESGDQIVLGEARVHVTIAGEDV